MASKHRLFCVFHNPDPTNFPWFSMIAVFQSHNMCPKAMPTSDGSGVRYSHSGSSRTWNVHQASLGRFFRGEKERCCCCSSIVPRGTKTISLEDVWIFVACTYSKQELRKQKLRNLEESRKHKHKSSSKQRKTHLGWMADSFNVSPGCVGYASTGMRWLTHLCP